MSIQDTDIQEVSSVIEDTPIAEVDYFSAPSKSGEDFKALKAAFIENYNTGKPVVEAYRDNKASYDIEANLSTLSKQKADVDNQELITAYDDSLLESPDMFTATAPSITQAIDKNTADATDHTKQFINAIAAPNVDENTKEALANSVKLYELLSQTTDKITTFDLIMDFSKSLIPFRDTINEATTLGSVWDNEDKLRSMIFEFKSKPFEEQQRLFPALRDEVFEGLGEIRGADLLTKFIEPVTEDELSDFSNWWKLPDVVDLASLGGTAILKAAKIKQSFNIPKLLSNAGDKDQAAAATMTAMVDDEAAEVMNIDKMTAAGNALPFDISIEDIGHTKAISSTTIKAIDDMFKKIDEVAGDIIEGRSYLREGILTTKERKLAEEMALSRLSNAKHENIQIVGKTENTTTFSYQAVDPDGNLSDETFELDLTLNDVGYWEQDQLPALSEFLASPTVFAKGAAKTDVYAAQRLDHQTAKVFNELMKLQSAAMKPLGNLLRPKNKKKLARVNNVLLDGDSYIDDITGERGKVFNVDELKGIYGLGDDEIQTYYATNRIYNNLWALRNNSKREEMIALDFKNIKLLDEESSFGKSFDTAGAAKKSLVDQRVTQIFDAVTDKVISNVSENLLEEQYALGKTLVKLADPYQVGGSRGKFTYALVDTEAVSELPLHVLPRKKGYVPKIAEDGFWFVKEHGDELINGANVTGRAVKTLRYFDNKAEANQYVEQLVKDAVEKGGLTEIQARNKFKALEDREQEIIATATGEFSHGSGGAYTGARAQDSILFGLNGDEGTRVNAYESLSRNIANVSRLVPINQWRLGLEQRWLNTANKLLGTRIDKFGELPSNINSTRKGEFLNKMANQIRDWQGFPSREEQVYKATAQRLHEWALKGGSDKVKQVTGWMRSADPISAARATAFHSLLGWANPAQLWVQMQGMSIAVSLNLGKNLTRTLRSTTALTMLGEGAAESTKRFQLAAKAAGVDADELADLHKAWKKSGLEDSVLQTADHAAAIKGHGIAMDALSTAADKSLFFYRGGELLSRRMAFATAYDEFKTANKAVELTDDNLKNIVDRANDLMLNMTKANRAQWQKGIASIPTQFFQVSAKAIETATGMNGNFTAAERGRMLAGQIALYGTAGVPLLNLGAIYGMEVLGITQKEIDDNPLLVKSWNDGFWGAMTLGIFGVDAEVSKRGSLLRGITDFVDNWIFSEDTVATKMMGAFGATNQRFWDEFTNQTRPIMVGAAPTDIISLAKIPTMPFLSTVSTWRNVEKAVFMETMDSIYTSRGDVKMERDFNFREVITAAIGFQLSDEAKPFALREREEAYTSVNKKIADMVIDRMNEVAKRDALGILDEDFVRESEEFYAVAVNSIEDYSRRKSIMESVSRRVMSGDRSTEAIRSYVDKLYSNTTAGLDTISTAILGTSILTVMPEEGEE